MNKRAAVAAGAIWLCLGLAAAGPVSGEAIRVSCRQAEVFRASASALDRVYLAHRPVLTGSETVAVDSLSLALDDGYWIDYAEGIVYLKAAVEPGRTVSVGYSVLPFTLRPAYQLRTLEPPAGKRAEKPAGVAPRVSARSPYDLRASGSKVISFEAGSLTDLRVSQALNLSIGGKIGEAVEVRGMLSDKDMTLSDRTSTARLQDLDRVFMEVRSEEAYARVGDLEINEASGELLSFRRELTGFLGDASRGSGRFVVSGAQARSRYETVELAGLEGIAGPYAIGAREGDDPGVVANSEKVWLDGESMKRGRNADYIIDYSTGEIYFNPTHLIRDGMKIVVDYESRREGGERQFYFARSSVGLGQRASMAVSFLNEGARGVESGAALDPLFTGGESSGTGASSGKDGGTYVGLGAGDYIKIVKDSAACYEYAGEGGGDYDVAFTWVGEGKGQYSYLFSERWQTEVYVHTGSGPYTDRLVAAQALSAQVVHVKASARPADGLEVVSEFAQSRGEKQSADGLWDLARDRAYLVGLTGAGDLPAVGGRGLGRVEMSARRRSIGQGYLAVARLRSPGALERWAQDPGEGAETANELAIAYRLGSKLATSAELGSLATPGGDSRRQKLAVDLGGPRLGLSAMSEGSHLVGSAGARGADQTAVALRVPLKVLDLSLGRTSDARRRLTDSTSVSRVEYSSGLRLAGEAGSVALALATSSETRDQGAGWQAYASSLDGKLDFETRQAGRLAVRGQVAHRDVTYVPDVNLGRRRMTSADLGLNLRDVPVVSLVSLDYGLANTLTSVYSTRLVKVGAGGDYDSLGNYTPGVGTHEITRYESGKQPVGRMKTALTVETGLKGKILLERTVSSRTTLELEGESSKPNLTRLAVAGPAFLLDKDQVVFGRTAFDEELVVNRLRGLTLALTAGVARSLDARCADRTEKDRKTRLEARLATTSFAKTTATAVWRFTSTQRAIKSGTALIDPSTRIWVARGDLERAFTTTLRGRLGVEVSREGRREPRSSILEGGLSSGLTVFWKALRCDTGVNVRRLLDQDAASRLLLVSRDSVDWNSRVNMRQGKYTSLAVEYVGRKTREVRTIHNLRASLSATF